MSETLHDVQIEVVSIPSIYVVAVDLNLIRWLVDIATTRFFL